MPGRVLGDGKDWFDVILSASTRRVRRRCGAAWLPLADREDPRLARLYGCGHFGCVFPVELTATVLKITRDAEEAAYAAATLQGWLRHDGVVRYVRGFEVEAAQEIVGERVFLLWREEVATSAIKDRIHGIPLDLRDAVDDPRALRAMAAIRGWATAAREAAFELIQGGEPHRAKSAWEASKRARATRTSALDVASTAIDVLVRDRVDQVLDPFGIDTKIKRGLAMARAAARELARRPHYQWVSSAFLSFLRRGFLMADFARDNVGFVHRDGAWRLVVTDPGYGVFFDPTLGNVDLPYF